MTAILSEEENQYKAIQLNQSEYDKYCHHAYNKESFDDDFYQPILYYWFPHTTLIHLFICNSNNKIFKHGICDISDLYNYNDLKQEQILKPFEDILEMQLFESINKYRKFKEENPYSKI